MSNLSYGHDILSFESIHSQKVTLNSVDADI